MAKLNKAEKFVKKQFEHGFTRNQVREAIFKKLGTWNFPPEYENALATQDPNYDIHDSGTIIGHDYMDERPDHSEEAELAVFGHSSLQHEKCVFCHQNPCVCETVELDELGLGYLKKLPEPGTAEWETVVDKMRADIEFMEQHAPIINAAHKIIENSIRCNDCDAVTRLDDNSTGYCESCGSANVRRRKFNEEFERYNREKGGNSHV